MPLVQKFYRLTPFAFMSVLIPIFCISNLALAADSPKSASAGENPPSYYIYHGERKELELRTNQLAIALKNSTKLDQLQPRSAALGVDFSSAEFMGVDGKYLVELSEPVADVNQAHQQIARLLSNPEITFVSPVFQGLNDTWITITPEILLRFKADYQAQADALLQELAPELEVVTKNFGSLSGAFVLRSSSPNGFEVLASANRLAQDHRVEWAEPDALFSGWGALIPNDPGFVDLWGFRNTGQFGGTPGMDMDADSAWDVTIGCEGIKVLIIDTGVEQDHPDLNQLPGEDFRGQGGGGGPVNECDNHGTAVAGCVTAIINNALGTVGIAPGCVVLSARAFTSNIPCTGGWSGNSSGTVNALAWGESLGVRVTNNSNYYGFTSSAIEAKYNSTWTNGMVHFAAAGNFSSPSITYPSSIPEVNAIAALEMDGTLASFSNWGIGLDFSAPGVTMYSTDRTGSDGYTSGDYVYFNGTSAASPYASGVAALILSQDSGLTSAQVEQIMQNGSRDLGTVGYDTTYGWGFVNANNSVLAVSMADPDTDAIAGPCDICPTVFNPLQENAKPGDVNGLLPISLPDAIHLVNYVFDKDRPATSCLGSDPGNCWTPSPLCRGEVNGTSPVGLPDVIHLVNYVFDKDRPATSCLGTDPGNCWTPVLSDVCCIEP